MRNNQIALVLAGLMFIMSAGTVWLLLRYNSSAKELQDLSLKIDLARNTQNFMQQLYNQTVEYSRKDSAIIPLLQWGTNNNGTVPVPTLPSAKPAVK